MINLYDTKAITLITVIAVINTLFYFGIKTIINMIK